jgi:hypothetical protein
VDAYDDSDERVGNVTAVADVLHADAWARSCARVLLTGV